MIGIFGGTFDPVHYGHLRAALEVKEHFELAQVRLVLSAQPPHRPPPKASIEQRLTMLELAVKDVPDFIIDTREIDRKGASYMILTLQSLREEFPEQPLLLFVGSDAFEKFTTWYQWQQVFDFSHVVVLTRPGYAINRMDDFVAKRLTKQRTELAKQIAGKLFFQPITQLEISATDIRAMLGSSKSPRFLLPDDVLMYISGHHLYQASQTN